MTHIKWQKLISSTQLRGYNTQFLLYPQALSCELEGQRLWGRHVSVSE